MKQTGDAVKALIKQDAEERPAGHFSRHFYLILQSSLKRRVFHGILVCDGLFTLWTVWSWAITMAINSKNILIRNDKVKTTGLQFLMLCSNLKIWYNAHCYDKKIVFALIITKLRMMNWKRHHLTPLMWFSSSVVSPSEGSPPTVWNLLLWTFGSRATMQNELWMWLGLGVPGWVAWGQ